MTPFDFLIVVVSITVAAAVSQRIFRLGQRRRLGALARQLGMHYVSFDRFRIAGRLGALLPVAGCAAIQVIDVIYGNVDDRHHYVFKVAFTVGVIHTKHRRVRVAALSEPRREPGAVARFVMLEDEKTTPDQYRQALRRIRGETESAGAPT